MKQKETRTLCYKCKQSYIQAGYILIYTNNRIKNNCDICGCVNGYEYFIKVK